MNFTGTSHSPSTTNCIGHTSLDEALDELWRFCIIGFFLFSFILHRQKNEIANTSTNVIKHGKASLEKLMGQELIKLIYERNSNYLVIYIKRWNIMPTIQDKGV